MLVKLLVKLMELWGEIGAHAGVPFFRHGIDCVHMLVEAWDDVSFPGLVHVRHF